MHCGYPPGISRSGQRNPRRVEFIVELRGPRMEVMDRLIQAFFQQFQAQGLTGEEYIRQSPTLCSPALIEESRRLCQALNFSSRDMFSGAGHDLINMAQITPSMLLFIPAERESATPSRSTAPRPIWFAGPSFC